MTSRALRKPNLHSGFAPGPVLSLCPTEEFTATTLLPELWNKGLTPVLAKALCNNNQKLILSSRQKPEVEFQRCGGVIRLCYISSKQAACTFLLRARAELNLAGTNLSAQFMELIKSL